MTLRIAFYESPRSRTFHLSANGSMFTLCGYRLREAAGWKQVYPHPAVVVCRHCARRLAAQEQEQEQEQTTP